MTEHYEINRWDHTSMSTGKIYGAKNLFGCDTKYSEDITYTYGEIFGNMALTQKFAGAEKVQKFLFQNVSPSAPTVSVQWHLNYTKIYLS